MVVHVTRRLLVVPSHRHTRNSASWVGFQHLHARKQNSVKKNNTDKKKNRKKNQLWDYLPGQHQRLSVCEVVSYLCSLCRYSFWFWPPVLVGNLRHRSRWLYNCIVRMGFLLCEIQVAFPRESQLQQSHATQPAVHAGCFSVSVIHWTLTWTTGSLMCAQMLVHVIAHGGALTP